MNDHPDRPIIFFQREKPDTPPEPPKLSERVQDAMDHARFSVIEAVKRIPRPPVARTAEQYPVDQQHVTLDPGGAEGDWERGKLTRMPEYSFSAKVFAHGSEFGLKNGRVSKLWLSRDGKPAASYDREWDHRPATFRDRRAVQEVLRGFPEPVREKSQSRAAQKTAGTDEDGERRTRLLKSLQQGKPKEQGKGRGVD